MSKTLKRTNAIGKIVLIDLIDMGLPRIFNLFKKKKSAKYKEVTYNKMRYACIRKLRAFVENKTRTKQGGFLSSKALV